MTSPMTTAIARQADDEHETLRRLAYEQRVPIAKLIREAVDKVYGTTGDEIQPAGRKPEKKE
jgi:hypothetical protein